MEESYLCQRCQSVDWDAAFAPTRHFHWRTVLTFRSTLEVRPDSRCRLCHAIASLFGLEDIEPTDEFDQRLSLVAVSASEILEEFLTSLDTPNYIWPIGDDCPTWLTGGEVDTLEYATVDSSRPRVIVENRALEPNESGLEFGTPRHTVDFDCLRCWLNNDIRLRRPDDKLSAHPLNLPGMRAIDCELREIIPLPAAHPEYATLSYVWGQSEAPCQTDGKLPDSLPLTIEDSITVCQELGIRYLWVDRYCIQESHKHALIRSMHRIYHKSQFTIVAAAGCGPEYGLPGVSSTPRSATTAVDHPIRVGARQLSCIDYIESYLKRSAQQTTHSRWAKRGWTLQEGMLSKRLCIFLDDEVHLETDLEAQCERFRPCERTQLGPKPTSTYLSLDYYWQTVSAFCSRDLSYPEDALNAMSGILSTWTQNARNFRHISGLAVRTGSCGRLLRATFLGSLAWGVSGPVPRRRGFPSWSWTGWLKPEVHGTQIYAQVYLYSLESVETDVGDIIHHTQLLDLLRVQHELLDSIKILHITVEVIDICIGSSESMPSIDQHFYDDQEPKSEWRAMIVSNGRETIYECEITKLVRKDDLCLSTSPQYIQCKGLIIGLLRKWRIDDLSFEREILVVVWDKDGGYYERFGILRIPRIHSVETKTETIRLG